MIRKNRLLSQFPSLSKGFFEGYAEIYAKKDHGAHAEKYREIFSTLPKKTPSKINVDQDCIQIGAGCDLNEEEKEQLNEHLQKLRFWRKGPFDIFGTHIDAEWQANLKWDRLNGHENALFKNKKILDVGASSGYYMLRMLAHNPSFILGIDPTFLYYKQFCYLHQFLEKKEQELMDYLVLGIENMDDFEAEFDTVVCMGILYHRPCSLTAIKRLKKLIKGEGTLLLESIIIDGKQGLHLGKHDRYAGMRNVYEIPTKEEMISWVQDAGFQNIEIIDISKTEQTEQRSTPWTTEVSLKDFLDPKDRNKTIEGYPAPKRLMVICK